jgi:DNA polymerase-3 subunit beta
MKLICSQSDLKTAIGNILPAIPSRPTHPILGNVLLNVVEDNVLELTGFDLSLGIRTRIPCQSFQSSVITVPARSFFDLVSRLPQEELTLSSNIDDSNDSPLLTLTHSSGKFTIQGLSSDEYPELASTNGEDEVICSPFNVKAFLSGIKATSFSASTDETKQVLCGINVSYSDCFTFASTDGHRLTVWESDLDEQDNDVPNPTHPLSVTIKASHLKDLEKLFSSSDPDSSFSVRFNDSSISFSNDQHFFLGRILSGSYPAYNQLIPLQFSISFTCDRKKLISAIDRVSVLSDTKNNLLTLSINSDNQSLSLNVSTREVGSASESLSAQVSSPDPTFSISFNIKYLLEGLKSFSANEVQFNCNQPDHPVVIIPLDGSKSKYLIMPVQIRD